MISLTSASKLKAIVSAIQKYYPISIADKTWDNTGLLVDSSSAQISNETKKISILLTIDLTQAVADEAIAQNANLILAYHPFIFKGLKSITQKDPQQTSLIRLIQNGISVYCPHTAVDAAKGGVNDWLVETVIPRDSNGEFVAYEKSIIEKNEIMEDTGMGRLITLSSPASLNELIKNIKTNLGLSHVQLSTSASDKDAKTIKSIAICAGSGGSLFRGLNADLYYTGELSHHEALYFKESGSSVIACNHSNTERGFLPVIKSQLLDELKNLGYEDTEIVISKVDTDPYETV
ncbi:hypothetical protein BVG19_g4013 [[Candida] boidinii]|nr:hypothetical protein BVG19_g4013 [[Candida] boidinii]OWB52817.1 hypothetical protein B5S27_g4399 [[Candida] boidinii]